jgi:hypothetical protein
MDLERQEYNGHRIELRPPEGAELREKEAQSILLIDDERIPYGQLPDGLYFLRDYAYDWHDNLIDLARSFIDYRDKTTQIRERPHGGGE